MNRKNLRKRGDGYAVVYYVPQELRATVGKREIVRGLGTRDEREAMRRKASKLLEIQAAVHRLAAGHREDTASLMREARDLAQNRKRMDPYGDAIDAFDLQIIDRAEGIADRDQSSRRAHRFADVALGRATPISVAAQEWRGLWKGLSERTRIKYERTLSLFQEHFEDCAIDRVTRRDAIHYVEHIRRTPSERTGKPLSERTIKTEVTTLASFFKACIARGFLPLTHENPFERAIVRLPGQKPDSGGRTDLRAVTREEAETLLAACDNAGRDRLRPLKYSFEMRAMLRLLWVTGARANEIASLTRERIEDEGELIWLKVEDAKTDAGNRLLCIVGEPERELVREALRRADQALNGEDIPAENRSLLFPRLRRGGADQQAYWFIGKAFQGVRKVTFGDDARWNIHSFRRRAVTALAEAGVLEQDRNLVIGHSNAKDFGILVYADAERRKTVERTMRALYEELGGSLGGDM